VQVLNADLAERGIGASPFPIRHAELRRVVRLAMMVGHRVAYLVAGCFFQQGVEPLKAADRT
jgi:hypothetical protein